MGRFCGLMRYWYLALVVAISVPGFAQNSKSDTLSLNERAYMASRVYASLVNFAHWRDLPDKDVEAAYRLYLGKALASDKRRDFTLASMEFLAGFHSAHTIFFDQMLIEQGGSLPFAAEFLHGKWVVTQSSVEELKPGDIIEDIDGVPFEKFYQELRRYISSSTEQFARRTLFESLGHSMPCAYLFPEEFVLQVQGGRKVHIRHKSLKDTPFPEAEGRWLEPGKVAYLRVPSFTDSDSEQHLLKLVREFQTAAVLIVDLRGNPGGRTPTEVVSMLMDRPFHWWAESTPIVLPYFRFRASEGQYQYQAFTRPEFFWPSAVGQPARDSFKGKLMLLVDAGCLSSCENFVMPFKDNGRAVLLGETTGGSSGDPYPVDLGHGMMAVISAKRESFPDGSRFEGVGIKPDIEIRPSIEDIRQGRDVVLDTARQR